MLEENEKEQGAFPQGLTDKELADKLNEYAEELKGPSTGTAHELFVINLRAPLIQLGSIEQFKRNIEKAVHEGQTITWIMLAFVILSCLFTGLSMFWIMTH